MPSILADTLQQSFKVIPSFCPSFSAVFAGTAVLFNWRYPQQVLLFKLERKETLLFFNPLEDITTKLYNPRGLLCDSYKNMLLSQDE